MNSEKLHTGIVVEACNRCFPADLWAPLNTGTAKYSGSLLPMDESVQSPPVKVSISLEEAEGVPPSKGTEVRTFFLNAGGIYSFKSPVLGWAGYKDVKHKGVISLGFPGQLKLAQRRNFFRVPFPLKNRANIDLTVEFREEKHVVQGKIIDLSGGGIAVRCVKSPMNFYEQGTKVELNFRLPRQYR